MQLCLLLCLCASHALVFKLVGLSADFLARVTTWSYGRLLLFVGEPDFEPACFAHQDRIRILPLTFAAYSLARCFWSIETMALNLLGLLTLDRALDYYLRYFNQWSITLGGLHYRIGDVGH